MSSAQTLPTRCRAANDRGPWLTRWLALRGAPRRPETSAPAGSGTALGRCVPTLNSFLTWRRPQDILTYAWTVNDPLDVQYASDVGVHLMVTDHAGQVDGCLERGPTEAEPEATSQRDPDERWRYVEAGIDPDGRLAAQALAKWPRPLSSRRSSVGSTGTQGPRSASNSPRSTPWCGER